MLDLRKWARRLKYARLVQTEKIAFRASTDFGIQTQQAVSVMSATKKSAMPPHVQLAAMEMPATRAPKESGIAHRLVAFVT
jgi:hypothetical protein